LAFFTCLAACIVLVAMIVEYSEKRKSVMTTENPLALTYAQNSNETFLETVIEDLVSVALTRPGLTLDPQ